MENREFHYEYSAPTAEERKEIVSIRKKYEPKSESKLDRLRALDKKVRNLPTALALSVGILGCLLFGLGLSMILVWSLWLGGALVAVAGAGVMLCAYPLYKKIGNRMQEKYAAQILALSSELLQS